MFSKGDKVVYGQTGVCVIEDIVEKALIKNEKKKYYVLKPLFQQNNVIYAPADSGKVLIRPVMTKQQAEELISRIPQIISGASDETGTIDSYREELEFHKAENLVLLTAQIYRKKKLAKLNRKKLGFVDEKYMHIAEELLFGEFSAVLGIPIEKVPEYIESKIKEK